MVCFLFWVKYMSVVFKFNFFPDSNICTGHIYSDADNSETKAHMSANQPSFYRENYHLLTFGFNKISFNLERSGESENYEIRKQEHDENFVHHGTAEGYT